MAKPISFAIEFYCTTCNRIAEAIRRNAINPYARHTIPTRTHPIESCHKCPLWIALYTIMFRCLLNGAPISCVFFLSCVWLHFIWNFFIESISIDNTRNRYWGRRRRKSVYKKIRHSAQQKGNLNASIFSSAVICDSHSFGSIEHNDGTVRQMIETFMRANRSQRLFISHCVCAIHAMRYNVCDGIAPIKMPAMVRTFSPSQRLVSNKLKSPVLWQIGAARCWRFSQLDA